MSFWCQIGFHKWEDHWWKRSSGDDYTLLEKRCQRDCCKKRKFRLRNET